MLPSASTRLLLLLALGLGLLGHPAAANPAPTPGEPPAGAGSAFLITLRPVQPDAAAGETEKSRITAHFDYLRTLREQGTLVLAGLTAEPYSEILIIKARDGAEAERILVADPAVRGNVFRSELRPFQIVVVGAGR
jgi:uncharacterized protein YciI